MARNKDFVLALKIKADLQNAVRQIDEVTGGLNQTARAGKKADRGARDAAGGMKKAQNAGEKLKDTLGAMAGLMVAAFAVHQVASFARGILDANEKLYQLSKTAEGLNVSVQFLGGLNEQAQDLDINIKQVGVVFGTLNRQLATAKRGSATAKAMFAAFDIDPTKINSTEEAFLAVADSVQKYGLNAERAGLLTQLFGATGKDIVPILKQGSAAIREQNAAMAKTGQIITQEDLPRIVELHNATDAIGDSFTALRNNLVIQLAPSFAEIADRFGEFVTNEGPQFVDAISDILDQLPDVATAFFDIASGAIKAAAKAAIFFDHVGKGLGLFFAQIATGGIDPNDGLGQLHHSLDQVNSDLKTLKQYRDAGGFSKAVGLVDTTAAHKVLGIPWWDEITPEKLKARIAALELQKKSYLNAIQNFGNHGPTVPTGKPSPEPPTKPDKTGSENDGAGNAARAVAQAAARAKATKAARAAAQAAARAKATKAARAAAQAAARAKATKAAQDAAVANKQLNATYNQMLGAIDPVTAANNRYNDVMAKATDAADKAKLARGANVQAIDNTLHAIKILAQGAREAALADIADKDRQAWEKLRDSMRTPVEASVDQAINKLKQLTDLFQRGKSGMTHEQYLDAATKIGTQSVTAAPQYQGLDASVGGIGSELSKNFEQQAKLDKWHEQALAHEQAFQAKNEAEAAAHKARLLAIDEQYKKESNKIQDARGALVLQTASGLFGELAKLQSSHNEKMARIGKAAAIAQAIINTYQSATGAYAALSSIPYVGPYLGAAAAAVAIAAGLANVAQIRSQPVGGHATGGAIRGPGTGTSDSIPAMLSNGEYVVSAKAAMAYGVGFLDRLNTLQVPAYAQGGIVASPADFAGVAAPNISVPTLPKMPVPTSSPARAIGDNIKIVVALDKDRIADEVMNSDTGQKVIVRTAGDNPNAIRGSWGQ